MSELLTATLSTFYSPVYNNVSTNLTASLSNVATTINVSSTASFPTSGVLSIGTEVVYYSGKTAFTFTGCTRNFDGTTAASYASGTLVELRWVAAHHNSLATEIIRIEDVLGQSISIGNDAVAGQVDYDNVDARITSFEDQKGTVTPPPVSSRFGGKYYHTSSGVWYIYNGSTWDLMVAGTLTPSSDDWDYVSPIGDTYGLGVSMVTPKLASYVNNAYGALLMTGTLSDQLNSISGFGVIGRDGDNLSYKSPLDRMIPILSADRIQAPYVISLNIDDPVVNKISVFSVMPENRNIHRIFLTAVGDAGYSELSLWKLTPGNTYGAAVAIATIGISTVNSITPASTSISLGAWNDVSYSISFGDLIYTRVTSVTGTQYRATATIDAPYYI